MLWLKYTKSGRSWTRVHSNDFPDRRLARTGSRISAVFQICEWQLMHVSVGGTPANAEVSTDVWQYLQSMPSSPTWCLWLKGTGCSRATSTRVLNEPWSSL